jgi:hypothetical protein
MNFVAVHACLSLIEEVTVLFTQVLSVAPAREQFSAQVAPESAPFPLQSLPDDAVRVKRVLSFGHQTHDLLIELLDLREEIRNGFSAQQPSTH